MGIKGVGIDALKEEKVNGRRDRDSKYLCPIPNALLFDFPREELYTRPRNGRAAGIPTFSEGVMEQPKIHYPAVLVAGLIQFFVGWLWYGMLFMNPWVEATGVPMDAAQTMSGGQMAMMYVGSLVAFLVVYYIMAHFVSYTKSTTAKQGMQTAFWLWLGFVATTILVNIIYTMKPFSLWLIDGGYWLVSMLAGGALLAVWRKKEAT